MHNLRKTTVFVANDDHQLLRDVFRFRYKIYIEELRFDMPDADHVLRILTDEIDKYSTIYALLNEANEVIASLRCTSAKALPTELLRVEYFGMTRFIDTFGIECIGNTSRFMFDKSWRRSTEILKLISAGLDFACRNGIRFNFGETNLTWLDYFQKLGYRRHKTHVIDPIFGLHVPLVMLVRDYSFFEKIGSPLRRGFSCEDYDKIAKNWFESEFSGFNLFSPLTRYGSESELIVEFEALVNSLMFPAHLPTAQLRKAILDRCSFIQLDIGERLTRPGEIDDTCFVCLSGGLVCLNSSHAVVKVIKPGTCFASEELLLGGARRWTHLSTSRSEVAVLPARTMRFMLSQYGDEFKAWAINSVC